MKRATRWHQSYGDQTFFFLFWSLNTPLTAKHSAFVASTCAKESNVKPISSFLSQVVAVRLTL